MAATNRFTTASTTAKALTMAAQLMSGGARQQEAVRALYGESRTVDRPQQRQPESTTMAATSGPTQKLAEALPQETLAQLQQAAEAMVTSGAPDEVTLATESPVETPAPAEDHTLEPGQEVVSPA